MLDGVEPAGNEPAGDADDRLYFRQLLAGRDFATGDPVASQMVNFVYLLGDRQTRECVVVDPAWNVDDLLAVAEQDGMKVTGALATHYHPDHVGGDLFGTEVRGIKDLLAQRGVKIHCNREEAPWIRRVTGVSEGDLALHDGGDVVEVGEIGVRLLHTPGHTPGSQCFLVEGRLVAGDTLFLQGCGRTDLPGGDPDAMYRSLTQTLAKVSDDVVLYPGHLYDPRPFATLAEARKTNYVLRVKNLEDWRRMM
jgi:glyoxylase-like metal-dependent hydrolase (beta-lactamase superfamily II)